MRPCEPRRATILPPSPEISDYDAALAYLADRLNVERTDPRRLDVDAAFRLDRMRALSAALSNPQQSCRSVHVAGSKGKGSVCEMVASALAGCGYTVGLYTSPHLIDVRERIRIGGRAIARSALTEAIARIARGERDLPQGPITHFEALTAAAFLCFQDRAVDIAVIEVGLGGLLDATNILRPDVCAITALHLEHADILGPTLADVARHKAGIFKTGVPALTIPQQPQAMAVLRTHADEVGCPLAVLGDGIHFEHTPRERGTPPSVTVRTGRRVFEQIPVPLPGDHQALNTGLALAIVERLADVGIKAPAAGVAAGLAKTPRHGRLELISRSPRVVIDGAHTPESVAAALCALRECFAFDNLVVIFGCASDKNARDMLGTIRAHADKLILTSAAANPRAADPQTLLGLAGGGAQTAPDMKAALRVATGAVKGGDLVLVLGSFAIAGEAKAILSAR